VRFDLTGADLAHVSYGRIKALDAKGTIAWNVAGPLEVNVSARGIAAPDWQLRSAALRVQGTRAAHAIALQANGERVDFRARAKGGWRPASGWSGVIEELVNSGEAAARLDGPVALTVGPQRVRVDPFELRLVGGRLQMGALSYERGRLSTAGRFTDLPVRPLLAVAGGPAAMAGTLRLSGHWSIESAPQLTGSVEITRESGDVALGAQRDIALGLHRLALGAKLTEHGATFQAELRSVYANASAEGRVSPVGAGANARYTRASPLAFTAAIVVARLAPFATFIDAAMLLEGALQAKLKGEGTVGSPLVTGPITGERIALALPAEGIELKDGVLKATLTQREVRVESFAIRGGDGLFSAQGTLARTGYDEASVDWRAERFTVLARPDRRLVVSGKGNASLRGGKLAFTGALTANEGLFELATTSLPTLGDDVVIVGRESATVETTELPPTPPRKATRAAVDMRIDLGNNVHVRGRGLDVWLSGDLRVQTDAQGQLRAIGTVDARRGTFVAYGQRLEIERGRFFFNGPLSNPALDIVAMRKRLAVEAGVAVTGTMQRPLVRVVSNPPLPEGEALSWLVLGRAPTQAGAGQFSALPLATTALMGKAGSALGKALRVDDIGVTSGGSGAAQQMLTVGKRLTERLYLAFEQSLGGTENLLRLEMSLTERIALRAQAGLTSSVGIYYRYFWD
jgi:translocation and assembly module TamB